MDCDEWDETVANSFVIENYGTHGIAPERVFAPYPTEVLAYEDQEVGDTPEDEAPIDDEVESPEEAEPDAGSDEADGGDGEGDES
jgi:hypothetical protein